MKNRTQLYRLPIGLSITLLLLAAAMVQAQQFNNEWIDYNKTYYRFQVAKPGIFRITKATLDAAGIGNSAAEHFQLWRNGSEVPLFTSIATGQLGTNDYIEFYGFQNDGAIDRSLYRVPAEHITDKQSLFTDTAAYFLTLNTTGGNLRITVVANNAGASQLTPATHIWRLVRHNYQFDDGIIRRPFVHRGFAVNYGEYVYSSAYDRGEMNSSPEIFPDQNNVDFTNRTGKFFNLLPYTTGGLNTKIRFSLGGSAPNTRSARVLLNNNTIFDRNLFQYETRVDSVTNISAASLQTPTVEIGVRNMSANPNDRIVAGFVEIDYPRLPDAANASQLDFYLPAGSAETLLEISNFPHNNTAPVLHNISNGQRMTGLIMPDGKVRFLLPAGASQRQLLLTAANSGAQQALTSFKTRNFVNYSLPGNQGNYIIITNPLLMDGGNNPINQYRTYRNSTAGGGFNTTIVLVDDLIDQFAYGVKMHPLSVKNFLRFARRRFTVAPQHCLLIGKGVVYDEYRALENHPAASRLQLVPTFGYPASDNLLASEDLTSNITMGIGRLNVINSSEVKRYLDKVIEFEAAQANTSTLQQDKAWMKNVVHVVGANDRTIESLIGPYMNNYAQIISDTLFGGRVNTFNKFSSTTGAIIENEQLENLFETGFSLMTYYGHSSATALDYNLDDPSRYNNPGKYPVFLLNGCNAGNFFTFDTTRLSAINTISEKYVLAEKRGAIAMIASTHFGIINGLNVYSTGFYRSLSGTSYNQPITRNIRDAITYQFQTSGANEYQARIHTEQQTLHGDPAIRINAFARPDYSVEPSNILINPSFLSIAETNFKTRVYYYNLGRAVNDSMVIEIKRQYPSSAIYPNGFTETVYSKKVKAPQSLDSVELTLPIISERDKGINRIIVNLETENRIAEISETNNSSTREIAIFENELRPVYPYNYAIVNKQNIKLVASTSNPFSEPLNYRMELDTTELFNSSIKVTRNISTAGGIIEFDPGITFTDSTVYYWRLGLVPATGGNPLRWNVSSFVYLNGTSTGYNQSHFYQHTKSLVNRISIDSNSRSWKFNTILNNVFVNHAIFPVTGTADNDFSVSVNNTLISASFCAGHSMVFNVFDPITFKPQRNYPGGAFGSALNNCVGPNDLLRQYNFEWDDRDTGKRRNIMNFMDAIPDGSYVLVRKVLDEPYDQETFVEELKSDEQYFGAGNSVYHRLKQAGFAEIDSFNRPRNYIFLYKKNDAAFTPVWRMSAGIQDRLQLNVNCPTTDTLGFITSPVFGPAKAWKEVQWRGRNIDNKMGDVPKVEVVGVNPAGAETSLYTLEENQQNFSIASVSPVQYPFIKLRMRNADTLNGTPYQLRWWRLYYDAVPEGALAGNILLQSKDTVFLGEPLNFRIAFKNISETAFDSLRLKAFVVDANNITRDIILPRKKPLVSGDTIIVSVNIDTRDLPGVNTLYVAVNPDNDQPEQAFFNNFLYKGFFVQDDKLNPVLDVTFDGTRILNRDIVSAKPHIQIKLKDENTFLALNDTAGLSIQLRYPGESTARSYRWGTDTLRLTPPNLSTGDNTAVVDFYPWLNVDTEGGEYELTVSGKDRNGNRAGNLDYRVTFQVFNKPMISNLLNYPNPFSTSTAFVFTITGEQVPQEFKIQIMTITGKIVKEITRQELGDIRIGTNITDYKWDGTDMFGQKLANGVYLYRVITSLNGNKMEKFRLNDGFDQNSQDLTDQFFNKAGYGKMVILR